MDTDTKRSEAESLQRIREAAVLLGVTEVTIDHRTKEDVELLGAMNMDTQRISLTIDQRTVKALMEAAAAMGCDESGSGLRHAAKAVLRAWTIVWEGVNSDSDESSYRENPPWHEEED